MFIETKLINWYVIAEINESHSTWNTCSDITWLNVNIEPRPWSNNVVIHDLNEGYRNILSQSRIIMSPDSKVTESGLLIVLKSLISTIGLVDEICLFYPFGSIGLLQCFIE